MRRVRKQKNIIIMVVMLALFIMASGYAIYQKRLDIGGVANIDWKDWNIRILSIDTVDSSSGVDVVKPSHTNTTAKFNSKITKVGGFIKYKIVVKNSGTIDGVLGAINIEDVSNSVITYNVEGVDIDDELKSGEEATIYVTATYDSSKVDTATSNKSNVNINLNYVQLEGYVSQKQPDYLILADYEQDSSWLYGPILKSNVESVNFTTSNVVPSDAKGSWDVSNEQNGSIMAWYYDTDGDNLAEITVGQTGGVKANPDSACLFCFLTNATTVNVNNLDTSEVTNMYEFFYNMWSIKELDLSSLNTSKVTNMYDMFGSDPKLEKITFGSNFDTSNVTTMAYMFLSNTSLKELDLSMFDTSKVTSYEWMFIGNNSLTTIYVSDKWNNSAIKNSDMMFTDCTSIVGSSGTTYDENNVDVNMANYQYGYFTYKETENSKVVPASSSFNGHGVVSGKLTKLDNNGNGEITFYWYDPSSVNTTDTITMPFIFLLDDGGSDCARYDDDLIITYDGKGLGSATIKVTDLYEDTYNYTEFVAVNDKFELP